MIKLFFVFMKRVSQGLRKYIRKEKVRIRREISDLEQQKQLIQDLYKQLNITSIKITQIPKQNLRFAAGQVAKVRG